MQNYTCTAGTAMNNAVKNRSRDDILRSLLHRNFNFAATDNDGNTVLHSVIMNEKLIEKHAVGIIMLLLNRGVSPNAENKMQETALHLAVISRKKEVIDLLIQRNAQVNKKSKNGSTIAHYFIDVEYKEFTQKLGFLKSKKGFSIENIKEIENESASFVEWLIEKGFDFDAKNESGESAVHLATNNYLLHILPVLLNRNIDVNCVNSCGDTLLGCLLSNDSYNKEIYDDIYVNRYASKIVKILLDRGASVDEAIHHSNLSALQIAIKQEKPMDIIRRLAYHFQKDQDKSHLATIRFYQMLNICASWGEKRTEVYLEILSDLLRKGANVNYKDELNYETPLYWAVKSENLDVINFLRDNGSDFQVRTKDGQNLLHEVINDSKCVTLEDMDFGYSLIFDIFYILLKEGCDVNAKDEDGTTPLHLAAKFKDVSANKYDESLVVYDSPDENCYSDQSDSYDAVYDRERDWNRYSRTSVNNSKSDTRVNRMLVALLKQGANVNAVDNDGNSALYYAFYAHLVANVKELLEWGADINHAHLQSFDNSSMESLLLNHRIKLRAANLYVLEEYNEIDENRNQRYYEECLYEVEKLKKKSITSSETLYTFLCMDLDRRCVYVNNENLLKIVNSTFLQETYPKYSDLILAKYREAMTRKVLLESTEDADQGTVQHEKGIDGSTLKNLEQSIDSPQVKKFKRTDS